MQSTQNRKHVITFSMNVSKSTPLIIFQKGGKRERNERRRQVQPSSNRWRMRERGEEMRKKREEKRGPNSKRG
ncbi:hypothetical protein NC651_026740 [Populus alba x Populus x berolinensis]|nr:hypothetical protein NC651_026706 [Populus alba x Populus x berolinensis]KAJ6886148.1 hypothetical protein NC651_026740 [Populus alba x Populus x berolinensis]